MLSYKEIKTIDRHLAEEKEARRVILQAKMDYINKPAVSDRLFAIVLTTVSIGGVALVLVLVKWLA